MDHKSGFSLIELILVIGLLMIITASATVYNSRWFLQNNLDNAKNVTLSSLRKAQSYAITKKNNLNWGVCLTGRIIRLYGGSCASPTIKDDYVLPDSVDINGLTTVSFSLLRGEPNAAQNISLSSSNQTVTIQVNLAGGISVN